MYRFPLGRKCLGGVSDEERKISKHVWQSSTQIFSSNRCTLRRFVLTVTLCILVGISITDCSSRDVGALFWLYGIRVVGFSVCMECFWNENEESTYDFIQRNSLGTWRMCWEVSMYVK